MFLSLARNCTAPTGGADYLLHLRRHGRTDFCRRNQADHYAQNRPGTHEFRKASLCRDKHRQDDAARHHHTTEIVGPQLGRPTIGWLPSSPGAGSQASLILRELAGPNLPAVWLQFHLETMDLSSELQLPVMPRGSSHPERHAGRRDLRSNRRGADGAPETLTQSGRPAHYRFLPHDHCLAPACQS